MSHQPFETWLLSDNSLDEDQEAALQTHLDACEHCQSLSTAWLHVQDTMTASVSHIPEPGFTQRWHKRLAVVRQQRQQRAMWLLTLGLFALAGIIFLALALTNLLSTDFFYALSQCIANFSLFAARINQVWRVFDTITAAIPFLVPILVIFGIGTLFAMIVLVITWFSSVIKLYKPVHEGVMDQ